VEFVMGRRWRHGGTKGRRHEVRGEAKGVRWLVDRLPGAVSAVSLPESESSLKDPIHFAQQVGHQLIRRDHSQVQRYLHLSHKFR